MAGEQMSSTRLEAFSDGVIAIIITIMALELKAPHADDAAQLFQLWPVFLSYVLSYLMVAIYWVNHHRLFHLMKQVDNRILWSNILLLFCMSLVPFATAYMGENNVSPFSTAVYSAVPLTSSASFMLMRRAIAARKRDDREYLLRHSAASGKNLFSLVLYALAIPAAFIHPAISLAACAIVGASYFVPEAYLCVKEE